MTVQPHPKKPFSLAKSAILVLFLILSAAAILPVSAQDEQGSDGKKNDPKRSPESKISTVIIEHVMDNHVWHFFDGHYGTLYLPVIVYSSERGLDIFSSRNLFDEHHGGIAYNGYKLEHNKIYLQDKETTDLSIKRMC